MPTVTNLRWISTDGRLRVSLGTAKRNLSRFSALTVRLAPDPSTSGPVDLTIRITDGDGNTKSTVVSNVSKALDRLTGVDFGLPKTVLRSVRIPLATLKGIDLSDVRTIDFLTNRVSTGSVFVSDLAAVKPSIGASGPIRLPRLSTHDLTVTEGDSGTQLMRFRVRLSRPSARTVRVHVDAANDFFFGDEVVTPVSKKLVFFPGQTQTTVAVRVRNNLFDGPDRIFPVVLAIPTEAILDQSIGVGTVLDDDPTPTVRFGNTIGFEAEGEARFPLTLSAPTSDGVFVDAEVTSGTAVLGSDMGPDSIAFGFIEPGAHSSCR
jgi:hypothetical protein